MKLQRTTLILLLLALGLGGFVYFMKFKVLLSGRKLRLRDKFSFEEDQVQSLQSRLGTDALV